MTLQTNRLILRNGSLIHDEVTSSKATTKEKYCKSKAHKIHVISSVEHKDTGAQRISKKPKADHTILNGLAWFIIV